MRFSVVIPAYNCSGTLVGTVDSIRASGLTDLEIILIDDGSTDGTSEVCDGLAGRFPEVRCVHQSNEGVSAARNRGIDESEGELSGSSIRMIRWMWGRLHVPPGSFRHGSRICLYSV